MEHKEKLRLAGIKRHGSEKAWRQFLRDSSNKSQRNKVGTGGFAMLKKTDPERLRQISVQGGKNGRTIKET